MKKEVVLVGKMTVESYMFDKYYVFLIVKDGQVYYLIRNDSKLRFDGFSFTEPKLLLWYYKTKEFKDYDVCIFLKEKKK